MVSHSYRYIIFVLFILIALLDLKPSDATEKNNSTLSQTEAERLFTLRVYPIFKNKCFGCHGNDPKDLRGDFDMLTREKLIRGGESAERTIISGHPEKSPLYNAVLWKGLEMPPKENDRLNEKETNYIRDWIKAGAPWPDSKTQLRIQKQEWSVLQNEDGIIVKTVGGQSDDWTYRRYRPEDIWAFQPLKKYSIPDGYLNPIDAFVGKQITKIGLKPAPRAELITLIRRATYDLTGLPPTPEEIQSFLKASDKNSNKAWEDLIDRLLANPHYGERWGQHWLDVVRYADTAGYSNDWERSNAWRYRDYVIRSFNDDKPYNKFIIEQIAGDELDSSNPENLIAAGFLRMGPWEHTAMSPARVTRQLYLDDLVNSIGQTFLSTAMRCCKCHDHKFDPLPIRDYYRMYSALATTQPAERPAEFLPIENREGFKTSLQHVQKQLKFATQKRDELYAKREEAAKKWYAERDRADEYVDYSKRRSNPSQDKPRRFIGLTNAETGILKVREQDVKIWNRSLERFKPMVQSVYSGGDLIQPSQRLRMPDPNKKNEINKSRIIPKSTIYEGGSVFVPGKPVTPGVLSLLKLPTHSDHSDRYGVSKEITGRRLDLARWIAHPKNSLTTRSIVNRVWGYHFGKGIAGNPNNFGATGKKPIHPELLDWLALTFVDNGWSIKKLHKIIMMSETYQRASHHPNFQLLQEKDPNKTSLAVFQPRHLSAEELRDSMLAISGELIREMGGLPVFPEINLEVALAPRMIQFSLAPAWQPSRTPKERNRRTIYAYRVRGLPDPLLQVFNKPGADESCELRDSASITPQAFTLMNSDVAINRSISFASRVSREKNTPEQQITQAYKLAIGEQPTDATLSKLVKHYEAMVKYHQQHQPKKIKYPTKITRSLVEEFTGDPFEYEELLDIYEDYIPDPEPSETPPQVRALADVCLIIFNSNAFAYIY